MPSILIVIWKWKWFMQADMKHLNIDYIMKSITHSEYK